MKPILLSILLLSVLFASSQNVGIGTFTPISKLHILGPDAATTNSFVTVESPGNNALAGIRLLSGGQNADFSLYGSGLSGTVFGVPIAGVARIINQGPVLIGASGSSKLYLGTNNNVRMTFDENGLGGINSSPFPNTQLNFTTVLRDGIYVSNNTAAPGIAFGVNSEIVSTVGSAIGGTASVNGESVSSFESGGYGVLATAGNTGIGGGFFTLAGTAIRAKSATGLALSTTGNLRFTNIGEGANKVLTGDASGNATWQNLPASAGAWTVSGTDIYNSNSGNVGIGLTTPQFGLHLNKTLFVNSNVGGIALGYDGGNHWAFQTNNGGADILLQNGSSNVLTGGTTRLYIRQDGNTGIGVDANNFSRLHVRRFDNANYAPLSFLGAIYSENGSTNNGSGVYGTTGAPRTGSAGFAGVTGTNVSTGTDMFGVVGLSSGSSAAGVPSAGVGGYGSYGVLGYSGDVNGAGVMAQSAASGGNALELNNGYIKVSGTNKAVFVHTATAANTTNHTTALTYTNQAATDMLIVTQNWNPGGVGGTYNANPVGVYWNGSGWLIFNENFVNMPLGSAYNVMVVKN